MLVDVGIDMDIGIERLRSPPSSTPMREPSACYERQFLLHDSVVNLVEIYKSTWRLSTKLMQELEQHLSLYSNRRSQFAYEFAHSAETKCWSKSIKGK